jgi:uncharacterized repeat protein (TIGR01451 family)
VAASVVAVAVMAANAAIAQAAGSPPSTLSFDHSGTACKSVSGHNLSTSPKMSQTGIALVGGNLLISCWGDTTITAINPLTGAEVTVYNISAGSYKAFGALAYDPTDHQLWACASTSNAGSGSPENKMSEVGTIDLGSQTFSPQFNSNGCDNGLAWDFGSGPGRADTLWTSADLATTIYRYARTGGAPLESHNVASLMGASAANSGIAIGGGKFYLANPQTTTKRVYSVKPDFSGYADPTEPVLSSTHRYEDMECDDQTFNTTVIWVMWFNQNILKPLPISGSCSTTAPPPPTLKVTQSSDGPVVTGSNVHFTDTVTNTGATSQTGVTLTEALPSNARYVSYSGSTGVSCSVGSSVTCTLPDLASGGVATVVVTFTTLIPGTVTSGATAQSAQAGPVSDSHPATVTAAPNTTYVTVNDSSIAGSNQPLGNSVQFVIEGSTAHSIADNSGLGLFSSGPLNPPAAYDFTYVASGSYSVIDSTTGHTASINVVPDSPSTGSVNVPFTVTWATVAPPNGFVEDIQVQKPGTTTWVAWTSGSTGVSGSYTPTQTGTYKFRARYKKTGGSATAYSTGTSTKVS